MKMIPLEYENLKWFIRTENKAILQAKRDTKQDELAQHFYDGARYMLKQLAKRYARDIMIRRKYEATV